MNLHVKGELYITDENGVKLNPRIIELLILVDSGMSLNNGVKELGMSYSYAWDTLYKFKCNGTVLIHMKRGGAGGGDSIVTASGHRLILWYKKVTIESEQFLREQKIEI